MSNGVRGEQTAQQSGHIEPVPDRCVEAGEQLLHRTPCGRRELQQPHVLPLDVLDPRGLAANLEQLAGGVDAECFRIGQGIGEAPRPEAAPQSVVTDDQ